MRYGRPSRRLIVAGGIKTQQEIDSLEALGMDAVVSAWLCIRARFRRKAKYDPFVELPMLRERHPEIYVLSIEILSCTCRP